VVVKDIPLFTPNTLMAREMEARDIIATLIAAGTFLALILKALAPDQAVAIIMTILGYYFGYKQGYERGVSSVGQRGREHG